MQITATAKGVVTDTLTHIVDLPFARLLRGCAVWVMSAQSRASPVTASTELAKFIVWHTV